MNAVFREVSVPGCVYGYSSMLHIAVGANEQPPDGYSWGESAPPVPPVEMPGDVGHALRLGMINEGVDLMGGGMMVSSAHTLADVEATIEAFRRTLHAMKDDGVLR